MSFVMSAFIVIVGISVAEVKLNRISKEKHF